MVESVDDENVGHRVHENTAGRFELTLTVAGDSESFDELAIRLKYLNTVVATICEKQMTIELVDANVDWPNEFAILTALASENVFGACFGCVVGRGSIEQLIDGGQLTQIVSDFVAEDGLLV